MNVWMVLFSLLLTPDATSVQAQDDTASPMRYRGIERLLAKFEQQEAR